MDSEYCAARRRAQPPLTGSIVGSDRCVVAGISIRASSPVLAVCRQLVAAGCDPDLGLELYRDDTLCLIIGSIGTAAALEINPKSTGFIGARAVRAAPPMRQNGPRAAPLSAADGGKPWPEKNDLGNERTPPCSLRQFFGGSTKDKGTDHARNDKQLEHGNQHRNHEHFSSGTRGRGV
jgi:hypothetical protein